MAKNPTGWTINPIASTADVIEYDVSTEPYDKSTQPYDGYAASSPSPTSWKNPTYYTPLSELSQQYYGGPSTVPLYAAPSHWNPNPGIVNEAGQYQTTAGSEADLDIWDNTTDSYDGSNSAVSPNYDSINPANPSFYSWKQPTGWTPVTGGSF